MPAGRPPKFKTPQELQKKIDGYFEQLEKDKANPTITGLVLFCGFCDRHSFYDMEKRKDFSHTIKKARTRLESFYESMLISGNAAGPIFALKNFGWKDKQEMEHSGGLKLLKLTDDEQAL